MNGPTSLKSVAPNDANCSLTGKMSQRGQMYENAFNSIERQFRAEEGIATELDYVEQISWVVFLKYLHDLGVERQDRAELDGETYTPLIDSPFRWDEWAAPKKDGQFDHNPALTGDDLIRFVDGQLFPYLGAFRQSAQ